MGRKDGVDTSPYFVPSQSIRMVEDTQRTVIPESIIKFWFLREFISTQKHRTENTPFIFFTSSYRIHIDFIIAIVRTKLDHVFFCRDEVVDFVLIQNTLNRVERFASFFSDLRRNDDIFPSRKREREHRMCWTIRIRKWCKNKVYILEFTDIETF